MKRERPWRRCDRGFPKQVSVWFSKQQPQWWEAVEVTDRDDWLVFPRENARRAGADEQAYRLARGLV